MFSDSKFIKQYCNVPFRSSYNNLADLDERERQRQDRMNIRYLHILRALIHNQVKLIDDGLKEEGQDPKKFRLLVIVVSESAVTKLTILGCVKM